MRAHCFLLHSFAVLLLCDYGMFSETATLPPNSLIQSNTSDSNITRTTAELTEETIAESTTKSIEESTTDTNYTDVKNQTSTAAPDGDGSSGTTAASSAARTQSTTRNTSTAAAAEKGSGENIAAGVTILIFIVILIVLLLGILYYLRKKGRSYSFDLTRVTPANDYDTPLQSDQQGISYEQTNKDLPVCLDFIQEEKPEETSSPVANGCAGEKTEQTPAEDNDEQNVPEEISFSSTSSSTPPLKKVEFNLDLDLIGAESEFSDPMSADEATDAAHNENNNNVTNAGRGAAEEIFTEISLDEPKEHL